MTSFAKLALAAASLAGLSACGSPGLVMRHPNPPPPPGYKVLCNTWRIPIEAAYTYCTPVIDRRDERVVIRAKG